MSLESWLLFCATEAVLCLSPGPSVLMVVSLSLTRGSSAGVRASLGVLAANGFYFALASLGLGTLIATSSELFLVLKWLGAAYLIWMGTRMVLATRRRPSSDNASQEAASGARSKPLTQGLITQGANANLLVYFSALLPQFIAPHAPLAKQVGILALSSVVIEFTVLSAYALLSARAARAVQRPALERPLRRLGGVLLIGAGARLAVIREP
jgi:homoserine/homoserine lactone efflux protein